MGQSLYKIKNKVILYEYEVKDNIQEITSKGWLTMCEGIEEVKKDEELRNRFIERYKPFIAQYASKLCHRYLQYGESDELSIALMAFNEAIDRFNGNGTFYEYAKVVMRSRLYDYFDSRTYREHHQHYSLDETENPDYYMNFVSQENYHQELRQNYLKDEIDILKEVLEQYDIELTDLYECCPKHLRSRQHVHQVIAKVLGHEEIVSSVIDQGRLPMKVIVDVAKTTNKKIEPYRKYIIAVIVICSGQFELLQEYMPEEVRRR